MNKAFVAITAAGLVATTACRRQESTPPEKPHRAAMAEPAAPPAARRAVEKLVEDAVKDQTGGSAKVDINGQITRVQTAHGEVQMASGASAALPDDFPKDIPVYSGATLSQVISTGESIHLMLASTTPQADVTRFYRDTLMAAGWGKEMEMQNAGNDMFSFVKGPRKVAIMVTRANNETLISLTVARP
ncbi:MAG: hypothetical protein K8T26_00705 [Lentisphaerae bacterium]|nr:hypothetical protein [Lentisphaerota bacterium]